MLSSQFTRARPRPCSLKVRIFLQNGAIRIRQCRLAMSGNSYRGHVGCNGTEIKAVGGQRRGRELPVAARAPFCPTDRDVAHVAAIHGAPKDEASPHPRGRRIVVVLSDGGSIVSSESSCPCSSATDRKPKNTGRIIWRDGGRKDGEGATGKTEDMSCDRATSGKIEKPSRL